MASATDAARVVRCPRCGRSNRVPAARHGVPHCGVCGAPLPWLAESSPADFHSVVEEAAIPVLVDFWAPWCAPCRVVSPLVEGMAQELPGRLKVVKVNSDDAPALSSRFGIRSIPTLVLLDHGNVMARITGALPAEALRKWVLDHLPAAGGASAPRGAQSGAP